MSDLLADFIGDVRIWFNLSDAERRRSPAARSAEAAGRHNVRVTAAEVSTSSFRPGCKPRALQNAFARDAGLAEETGRVRRAARVLLARDRWKPAKPIFRNISKAACPPGTAMRLRLSAFANSSKPSSDGFTTRRRRAFEPPRRARQDAALALRLTFALPCLRPTTTYSARSSSAWKYAQSASLRRRSRHDAPEASAMRSSRETMA